MRVYAFTAAVAVAVAVGAAVGAALAAAVGFCTDDAAPVLVVAKLCTRFRSTILVAGEFAPLLQ